MCSLTLVSTIVHVGVKMGDKLFPLDQVYKDCHLLVCAMGKWQHVANCPSWQRCDDGMAEICRHMEWWLGWWGGYFMGSGKAMMMPVCAQWKWINNKNLFMLIFSSSLIYVITMDTSQMQLTGPHVMSFPFCFIINSVHCY